MPSFKITLAYDGAGFVGWQRQAAGVSIQGLLEDAVRALDDRDVTVIGAGRTDAGVHALGQVAAFTLTRPIATESLLRALNARPPDAVRVLSAEEAPASFNPRFDAAAKAYRYRIWNHDVSNPFERCYAWHVAGALDVAAMDASARQLEGRHDFAAFQSAGSDPKSTERELLSSRVERTSGSASEKGTGVFSRKIHPSLFPTAILVYDVVGSGFLRHMVRAIVGSLVDVGRGRRPPEWIGDVLASRDRGAAGPTAPAQGLFLMRVDYGSTLADEP